MYFRDSGILKVFCCWQITSMVGTNFYLVSTVCASSRLATNAIQTCCAWPVYCNRAVGHQRDKKKVANLKKTPKIRPSETVLNSRKTSLKIHWFLHGFSKFRDFKSSLYCLTKSLFSLVHLLFSFIRSVLRGGLELQWCTAQFAHLLIRALEDFKKLGFQFANSRTKREVFKLKIRDFLC